MANKSLWSVNSVHSPSASSTVTPKSSGQVTVNTEFCQTLDFAMRNLSQSNDMMVKGVLDQNKTLNDTMRLMTEQLREMTLVNKELANTNNVLIEELKTLRQETGDLKVEKATKSETPSLRQDSAQTSHNQTMQQNPSNFNTLLAPQQQSAFQSLFQAQNVVPYQQMPITYPQTAFNQYGLVMSDQQSLNQLAQNYLSSMIGLQQQQPQQQVTSAFQPQIQSQQLFHQLPSVTSALEAQAPAKPISNVLSSQTKEMKAKSKSQTTPATTPSAPSVKPVSGPLTIQQQQQQPSTVNSGGNIFKQAAATTSQTLSQPPFGLATTQKQPTFAEMAAAAAAKTPATAAVTAPKTTAPSNVFASLSFTKSPTTTTSITSTPVASVATSGRSIFGGSSLFAISDSSSSFAQLSQKTAASADDKKATTSATFFGAGRPVFGSVTHKSPTETKGKEDTGDDNDDQENFEPAVDFKPLIPLPALVQVKTGEEDEEVLFKERAKLFRFDPSKNEFKERGTGDLKLLKNNDTNRTRLLMRRDQTLKLCANHYLNDKIKLLSLAKSDKAFTWQCQDFSDNDLKPETLAVRFKTAEMAQNFKNVFEKAAGQSPAGEDKQ